MTHDFDKEIRVARELKEIMDKEEGMAQNSSAMSQVGKVVTNHLFDLPKHALDAIYEKLEKLKSVGTDVERQTQIYQNYRSQLQTIVARLQTEDETVSFESIERVIQALREFIYLLAYIDFFKGEVDSLCKTYITMIGKFAP